MKDSKPKHNKSGPKHGGDHEGRMGSPIAGNPAQRKSQVQSIANDVMGPDVPGEGPDREDSSEESIDRPANPSPAGAMIARLHSHTTHDHTTGQSVTHSVQHGQPCPACGTEYIGGM